MIYKTGMAYLLRKNMNPYKNDKIVAIYYYIYYIHTYIIYMPSLCYYIYFIL